jgi:glycosyltransferase involved in cell wall biosynthesis
VIGRVVPEKGVATALEAARVAGVDVTVAGDGPQLPELRRRFPEVRFVGHLGAPEMRRLVESLRAVIVPSLWFENAPMSALEAMAAGVPVIASDLGGLPEIVTHGVSGLLCVPGDVASFASALSTLKDDIGKAAEMGECARAEVSSRFSPEAHLTGILNSYRLAGAGCA